MINSSTLTNHPLSIFKRHPRTVITAVVAALLTLVVALPVLANNVWTLTGDMSTPRTSHSVTALNNGMALVVGGATQGGGTLNTAELYNPATGGWTATGNTPGFYYSHTATLLSNGQVLVAGGGSGSSQAALYNPATGAWTGAGSMNSGRQDHTATLLNDNRVLVTGGDVSICEFGSNCPPFDDAELYDSATGAWTVAGAMNIARNYNTATLLNDGRVLVAGGNVKGNQSTPMADAELYDPATDTWSTTASMTTARREHYAVLLPDGRVLVAGGRPDCCSTLTSAEIYDPATGAWTPTASMAHTHDSATLLADGRVMVTGGLYTETYDPATGVWSDAGNLNVLRWGSEATQLGNGQMLVVGGANGSTVLQSAEVYGTTPPPPPSGEVHVGDLDGSSSTAGRKRWRATVTITALDNNGSSVANANVSGDWSGGTSGSASCTTDGSGVCSVTSAKIKNRRGSVTFTVSGISHATLTYNAAANTDPDGDSDGTTITVSKP